MCYSNERGVSGTICFPIKHRIDAAVQRQLFGHLSKSAVGVRGEHGKTPIPSDSLLTGAVQVAVHGFPGKP